LILAIREPTGGRPSRVLHVAKSMASNDRVPSRFGYEQPLKLSIIAPFLWACQLQAKVVESSKR